MRTVIFSQIADKAQRAINQTPLTAIAPGHPLGSPSSLLRTKQQGGNCPHTKSLQHQLRNIGQQYTNTNPLQRIITINKGVVLDLDGLARNAKAQNKELYT